MTIITIGGIIFWLLTTVVAFALILEVSTDSFRSAFWTIVAYAIGLAVFSDSRSSLLPYIERHPLSIVYAAAAYIGAGAVWCLVKWYLYVLNQRDAYEAFRESWFQAHNITGELLGSDKKAFLDAVNSKFSYRSIPPRASEHKTKITAWMAYWPFSVVSTFVGDLIVRVFTTIYRSLTGLMQNISNRVFGKYAELN